MADHGFSVAQNIYELPTRQRRLRHLKSISVRNLVSAQCSGKDVSKLKSFFTLHSNKKTKAFYESEKLLGSLNPTWQSFDLSKCDNSDTSAKCILAAFSVVVRVWVGHGAFRPLLEWELYLSSLVLLDPKMLKDGIKFAANSLVFGIFDQFFMAPTPEELQQNSEDEVGMVACHVDQTSVRNSYGISSLSRIHTILRAIKQTQASVKRLHKSLEDRLVASQEKTRRLAKHEELLLRTVQLRNELTWQTSNLQMEKDEHDRQKSINENDNSILVEKMCQLNASKKELEERRKKHNEMRERLVKENAQLWIRQKQMISELALYIYPVTENSDQCFICGVRLPNAEDSQGHDDNTMAVGLGYTCHMMLMLSRILNLPLRYPMEHWSSRSMVVDHIHTKLTDRERSFPLYCKGKKDFYFQYGVFLLNKNISQLRWYCGLVTADLRLTLPNLKSLLEIKLGVRSDQTICWRGPTLPGKLPLPGLGQAKVPQTGAASKNMAAKHYQNTLPSRELGDANDHKRGISLTENSQIKVKPISSRLGENENLFDRTNDCFFQISQPDSNVATLPASTGIEANQGKVIDVHEVGKTASINYLPVDEVDKAEEAADWLNMSYDSAAAANGSSQNNGYDCLVLPVNSCGNVLWLGSEPEIESTSMHSPKRTFKTSAFRTNTSNLYNQISPEEETTSSSASSMNDEQSSDLTCVETG